MSCKNVRTDRATLVRRRVELNRLIRRATLVRNAIPKLCDKPWACQWRRQFTRPLEAEIRRHKRELAAIAKLIGPPPKMFKTRSLRGECRMLRLYAPAYGATRKLFAA